MRHHLCLMSMLRLVLYHPPPPSPHSGRWGLDTGGERHTQRANPTRRKKKVLKIAVDLGESWTRAGDGQSGKRYLILVR